MPRVGGFRAHTSVIALTIFRESVFPAIRPRANALIMNAESSPQPNARGLPTSQEMMRSFLAHRLSVRFAVGPAVAREARSAAWARLTTMAARSAADRFELAPRRLFRSHRAVARMPQTAIPSRILSRLPPRAISPSRAIIPSDSRHISYIILNRNGAHDAGR